jgi:sugar-specific transcriptional regulator TrmB
MNMPKKLDGRHRNCQCHKNTLEGSEERFLAEIGLSKNAIQLYNKLLVLGPLSVQDAAAHTLDFPSAHYRLFYELEKTGLVRRDSAKPLKFTALPVRVGLQASLKTKEKQLSNLLEGALKDTKTTEDGDTQIITGRKALYDIYAKYCEQAEEEVSIYSIGIAYSKKLEKTQKKLQTDNIQVRHIIQQYKTANYHIINKWLRAGVNLKYHETPRGFHFFVIDKKWVCVTFSNPDDTDNRISILTDNSAALELFRAQFDQLWATARKIKL